jgi:anti-sigma factor RsiW
MDDAHRQLRESLGAYALGQLDPDERAEVRAHLDDCCGCRDTLAEIEPLAAPLRLIDGDRMHEPVRPRHRREISRWALMAAVAALVGSGIGYAIAPKPPELPLEPVAVRVSTPSVESTAEVVPHSWGMEIKLTGSGFDPGLAYRVFVRARDGREVNAGEFVGTGPATMHCNLNTSVLRADAVGFRVVDEDGQEVMTSSLL